MSFDDLKIELNLSHDRLKAQADVIFNEIYDPNSKIYLDTRSEIVEMFELEADGRIKKYNASYSISMYQYLSKVVTFINMPEEVYYREFSNFRIDGEQMPPSTPTQRDAWFITINGLRNFRNFAQNCNDDFVALGEEKKVKHTLTVLLISASCIGISVVAAIILIPFTFSLDNEERNAAKKWILISNMTK